MVFMQPQRLVVPLFQRPYVWNEENQWEPLWDDVVRVTDRVLNQPPRSTILIFSARWCCNRFRSKPAKCRSEPSYFRGIRLKFVAHLASNCCSQSSAASPSFRVTSSTVRLWRIPLPIRRAH